MTLEQFRKTAFQGECSNCYRHTLVGKFLHPLHQQVSVDYCYVCSKLAPMCTTGDSRIFLAATSLLIDAIKPPKKPRQPKTEGPSVHPMRPRRS